MRNRVEHLFHEVADLSAEARARYFDERDVDARTRQEVEALVAFDSQASTSLEQEIGQVAQRALGRLEPKDIPCGVFRLGELLGRGGMGAVYLAERVDGEVTQRVAIKLLRPGADDPQVRQRFLAERQILASLSHPHIARLVDAGHREDGQPYLVMEYVKGKPIDVYTASLGVRHKLALFRKVCGAVSYLHRNLVVHRDLKPSNILVTEEGEPKLLDFGLAKLIDLTTDSTMTSMRMLTPDFASPEQVMGGAVTTATDVYSLGAVLYRLLTGECPHQFEGDSAKSIAMAISEGKIVAPSRLAPGIKSDLEMVLMKALRREPQERYATIDQFSEDLENFLESRPIRARKGEAWYRVRKFVSRHWLPVAAAVLIIASLATGLALATRERSMAQRRFTEVRELANKLFDIDAEARKVPGNTKTRQLIVNTSLDYLRRLSADAYGDRELALDVGNAYMRVARVQGVPISQNLGQMDQADQTLRIAEAFMQSAAVQPVHRVALLRSAQIAHDRMLLARLGGRSEEALTFARKSASWLEKFNAGSSDQAESPAILLTYLNVGDQFAISQQFDDALGLCRHASNLARSLNSPLYVGTFHWVSGQVLRRRGDLDQALADMRESVKILDPGSGTSEQGRVMNHIYALVNEGWVLGEDRGISLGRSDEAAGVLRHAFSLADDFVHKDPNDQNSRGRLAVAGLALAGILRHSDARQSLAIYDHVLRHTGEIPDNSSFRRFEVTALAGASYPLRRLGRVGEAGQRLESALDRLRQTHDYPAEKIKPGSEPDLTLSALADHQGDTHNIPQAIETYTQLLTKVFAWAPKPETDLAHAVNLSRLYTALAALHHQAGQTDLAASFGSRRVALWRQWDARLPHNDFVRRQLNAATVPVSASQPDTRGQGSP